MYVVVDYREKLLAAYRAGAAATVLHLKMNGPKPDAEAWLDKKAASRPPVARL